MGLTAVGLGSGLDINNIVKVLVDAEKVPKQAVLDSREATIQGQISAFGSIKSSLTAFQDTLKALSDATTFAPRSVTLSQKDYLSASATSEAVAGSYNIQVEQLAESQKLGTGVVADPQAAIGAGSLDLTVNGNSFSVTVDAEDSLQDIMKKINEDENNVGVNATIVTDDTGSRLILSSEESGTENTIGVAATGDAALTGIFASTTELQPAKDAIIHIDGLRVTSSSNSVDGAIDGVTLDLTKADLGETTRVTIANDDDKIIDNIESFVDAYNEMMTTLADLTAYNAETEKSSTLQGDSLPRGIQNQMRGIVGSLFDTRDGQKSLSMFGISTDRYGKMEIDKDKLKEAVGNDIGGLTDLFATEGTGLAARFDEAVDTYAGTGGLIDGREDSMDRQLKRIEKDRDDLNARMLAYENRLYAQFNAMDMAVASLNSQSADLASRFDALPGFTRKTS
ncbi:flagellar hook protein FliD [Ferrimonas sediminicola]|uniref:Flagellar hook-associated protein 2 n=1 Tax=Ferrimonas sediminicola TaxID=2569538 RepID=A0A4U1BAS2_9GAMM|nr:flagellar filament capping protein FliD [Ferrimonas sediminicola]TKB47249.1 flagellar hook protein FliD [Ferrimonas sediminicola]